MLYSHVLTPHRPPCAVYVSDQDVTGYLATSQPMRIRGSGVVITLGADRSHQTVTLATDLMAFTVVAEAQWLNIRTNILDPSVADMHGIIGQTWRNGKPYSLPVVDGKVQWDGSMDDYVVSDGLFGIAGGPFVLFEDGATTKTKDNVHRRFTMEVMRVLQPMTAGHAANSKPLAASSTLF